MKLSTAMMLGSTTCKMLPGNMNSCAFGAALNALGVPQEEPSYMRYTPLRKHWPWLTEDESRLSEPAKEIYGRFDFNVCQGLMTLEQLVDYVRSIEPACGECNSFSCTCVTSETAEEAVQVVHV